MRRSGIRDLARKDPAPVDRFAQNILPSELISGPMESLMDQCGIAEPFQRNKFVAWTCFGAIQCPKQVRQPVFHAPLVRRLACTRDSAGRRLYRLFRRRKRYSNRIRVRVPIPLERGISSLFSVSAMEVHIALISFPQDSRLAQKLGDAMRKS